MGKLTFIERLELERRFLAGLKQELTFLEGELSFLEGESRSS